jgi:hypothetical protein
MNNQDKIYFDLKEAFQKYEGQTLKEKLKEICTPEVIAESNRQNYLYIQERKATYR